MKLKELTYEEVTRRLRILGTIRAIIREVDLSVEEFMRLKGPRGQAVRFEHIRCDV